MKKRILQTVSAFISLAIAIPMLGANVNAATRAKELYDYIKANGRTSSDSSVTSLTHFDDDHIGFTMVYDQNDLPEIWLSYSRHYEDHDDSVFFIYNVDEDAIDDVPLVSVTLEDGSRGLYGAENFTTAYEPGQALEFSTVTEASKSTTDGAYKQYLDSIVADGMLNINAFMKSFSYSLADLGFTSQNLVNGTPGVVVTPAPTEAPTPTPTSAPLPDFDPNAGSESGVNGFVDRLYTVVLGRAAEKDGKDYWAGELSSRTQDGATAANGFLNSQEFIDKNYDDASFVEILYRLFFGRNSDKAGIDYWTGELKAGQTRSWVISGFVNSEEWANICVEYGIKSGGSAKPTTNFKPNKKVSDFASRLYTTCLGRDAEKAGLDYWAGELANMRTTGKEAAMGFFFSEEFTKANYSNKEFINRLYKTFMGREADKAGFDYWNGQLKDGATREFVFLGFANAPEFADLCAEAGIINN